MDELIPKEVQETPAWQTILFYGSLILVALTVGGFFFLNNSINQAKKSLSSLEETLAEEKTSQETSLENYVLSWQKKINDFSQIISLHIYPSNFFNFIGKIAHPKAWFQQVSLNLKESKVVVSGETESFTTLGQQLIILGQDPLIKGFSLTSLSVGKQGGVAFVFNIEIDHKLFQSK